MTAGRGERAGAAPAGFRRHRTWATGAYVAATLPLRAWRRAMDAREGRAPFLVLAYHRIADDAASSWTCSRRSFERQLDWLAERFELVSLSEGQRRLREGNRAACVALTFDDGYQENCDAALPLLLERRVPVTYFVTFDNVARSEPFEHDVAMGNSFRPNTPAELRDLAAAGIEIGAHGRTHRDVAAITDPQELAREIVSVRGDLEALVGASVKSYAFPFGLPGNLSGAGFAAARRAGYIAACSAYGGYNVPGDDDFHVLRRSGTDSMIRLVDWATHDFRQAALPRFRA